MSRKFWLEVTRSSRYPKFKACPFDRLRPGSERRRIQNPKRLAGFFVIVVTFAFCGAVVHAQQRSGSFRIGVLEPGYRPLELTSRPGCNVGFREGMSKLGWIEGKNLHIEERHGEFQPDRLRALAAELVRMAPPVIWTHSRPLCVRPSTRQTQFPSLSASLPIWSSKAWSLAV